MPINPQISKYLSGKYNLGLAKETEEFDPSPADVGNPAPLPPEKSTPKADYGQMYKDTAADNTEIAAARSEQSRAGAVGMFGEGIANALTSVSRARGGAAVDSDYFKRIASSADNGVEQAQANQKNKLSSILAQEGFGDRASDRDHQGKMRPLDLESKQNANANQKWGAARNQTLAGREDSEHTRTQSMQSDEDNIESGVSATYRTLAKKLMPTGKFDGLSASKIKALIPGLEGVYRVDEQRRSRLESARALAGQQKIASEEKQSAKDEKQKEADLLTAIPGYDKNGTAAVKPEAAEKLRKAEATRANIDRQVVELKELQKKYGNFETGANGERMQNLSTTIQLQMKELQNLGVLSGPDLELMRKQVPDLGGWNQLFSINSNTAAGLGQTHKDLNSRVHTELEKQGYIPSQAPDTDKPQGNKPSWRDF